MILSNLGTQQQAILAFDRVAQNYDDVFTRSARGRTQRSAVWEVLAKFFHIGDRILEINCGTGEDAVFLSRRGTYILACDASQHMVKVARNRILLESLDDQVRVELVPTEYLDTFPQLPQFDGVFSNFSGLNCVGDLETTAKHLSALVKPGSPMIFCLSTRFCLFEILWFLTHGEFRKAFRRTSGRAVARLEGFQFQVQYPTLRKLRDIFSLDFKLRFYRGVGIFVPPSYVEHWACMHPRAFRMLEFLDRLTCDLPWFRVVGDHVLVCFERMDS